MFYSQDILNRRSGIFGRIWLAATKAVRLRRQDYCSVNIIKTCDHLLAYILVNQSRGKSRLQMRLSLYLSSLLTNGVVKVYHKQVTYLFVDALTLTKRFSHFVDTAAGIDIEMERQEQRKTSDVVPNMTELLALETSFGILKSTELADWNTIPDVDTWDLPSAKFELSTSFEELSASLSPVKPFEPVLNSPFQADRQSITLLEEDFPPTEPLTVPGEEDLPPLDIEQLTDVEGLLPSKPKEGETEDEKTPSEGTDLVDKLDRERLLPTEETPLDLSGFDIQYVAAQPAAADHSPPFTPVSPDAPVMEKRKRIQRRLYEMELEPCMEEQAKKPAKQQKSRLIIDPVTEIPREQIRGQITNHHQTCQPLNLASFPQKTAKQMFSAPTTKGFYSQKLRKLWQRNAVASGHKKDDSFIKRPAWPATQLLYAGDSSSDSGKEAYRDVALEGLPLSPVPEIPEGIRDMSTGAELPRVSHLQQSEEVDVNITGESMLLQSRDQTSSFLKDSLQRSSSMYSARSPHDKEAPPAETTVPEPELDILHEVSDELVISPKTKRPVDSELPETETSPSKRKKITTSEDLEEVTLSPIPHHLIRRVAEETETAISTTFQIICPYQKTRKQAAKMFSALLNLAKAQKVAVIQERPYSTIIIMKGPKW